MVKSLGDITHGDIIIFKYPKNPELDYIFRVIGLPGDTIEIRDKVLYINGRLKNERYAIHNDYRIFPAETLPRDNIGPLHIKEGGPKVIPRGMGLHRCPYDNSRPFKG